MAICNMRIADRSEAAEENFVTDILIRTISNMD